MTTAPANRDTPPSIRAIEGAFVMQNAAWDETGVKVHERWAMIQQNLPEMRERHLWDDHTEFYAKAEQTLTGTPLLAAAAYADFQARFWEHLMERNRCQIHVFAFHYANACMWVERMHHRLMETRAATIRRGKVKAPYLPKPKILEYLN